MTSNIIYEQQNRFSIVDTWKRRGKDTILLAYLRDELEAPVAAQALGLNDAGQLHGAALVWTAELGKLAGLNDMTVSSVIELATLHDLVGQYEQIIVQIIGECNRLNARLLDFQRQRALKVLRETGDHDGKANYI